MNKPTVEHLHGSKVKLSFHVTVEEARPFLDETVRAMSEANPIQGFRPGKAPYAEAVKAYGEMRVWQNALERIVRSRYLRAVLDQDLDTVGSPEVRVDKLTPGADIEFTVIAPVAPKVTKLADYSAPLVDFTARTVTDADVLKALGDLRTMRRKEVRSTEPATNEDLVVIDLDMKKDKVTLEGGTGRDYRIYLTEDNYIPGFADKLVGVKEGEERTFTLKFPESHYQKHLAGKDVDFTATTKGVFKLELPDLDEAFAASLGQSSLDALKKGVDELKLEFVPQAVRRIKAATIVKEISKREKVTVTDTELDHEIDHILEGIKSDDRETRERVSSPEYREYVAILLRNQKTLEVVKQKAIRNYVPRKPHHHDK